MSSILSLNDFKAEERFGVGSWIVEYNDTTHLPKEVFLKIGRFEIKDITSSGDTLFKFQPVASRLASRTQETPGGEKADLESSLESAWVKQTLGPQSVDNAARYIIDQLVESLVRLGLLQLNFDIDDPRFEERKFATIIFDTNALRDGSIRHLKEQFPHIQLWTIIPMVSLMEISERTENIKSTAKGKMGAGGANVIRVRPQSTIAPQEVKWIKENFPSETLELAPELLRTFRGFEKGNDPDRSSINDRLILEGIKDLRRQRGLPEGVYFMSGDKGISRSARLEGIRTLYPARITAEEFSGNIYSVRYSLTARRFICCSIHRFLWDLAHIFSRVRARCESGAQSGRVVEIFYYYPTKLVNDWMDDKMEISSFGSGLAANPV